MERWIELSEAERLVSEALDDAAKARDELVAAFTWGEVSTRAAAYWVTEQHKLPQRRNLEALPAAFWQKADIDWSGSAGIVGTSYREGDAIVEWDSEVKAEGIRVRLRDLESRWLGRSGADEGAKRGPKFVYDWDAMWIEACRIVHAEGLPERQSTLVERLLSHFGEASPSVSLVKSRVSKLYKALGQ